MECNAAGCNGRKGVAAELFKWLITLRTMSSMDARDCVLSGRRLHLGGVMD